MRGVPTLNVPHTGDISFSLLDRLPLLRYVNEIGKKQRAKK